MVAAFLASAVAHLLLFGVATRRWGIACMCGAFFAVQPVFILAERRMEVRRWRPVAARAWTLAALAIPLPLFIEPTLQCLEPSWGPPESVLLPATGVLGVGVILNTLYSLASLACCPRLILPMQAPQATAAPD